MITPKQAVNYAADIYNPHNHAVFDTVLRIAGWDVGVKNLGDVTVIAPAGSHKPFDFLVDSFIIPEYHKDIGVVAAGFMIGADEVFESLLSYIQEANLISFAGHSLGCSHSIILAKKIINAGFNKIYSMDLFAPPKTSYSEVRDFILSHVNEVRAYVNGIDPVPTVPIGKHWSQYDLIHLNEEPDHPWQLDPVRWHMIDLYKRGVEKL